VGCYCVWCIVYYLGIVKKKKKLEVNDTQLLLVKPKRTDVLDFSSVFACILLNVHFNWKVFRVQGTYLNWQCVLYIEKCE